MIPFDIDEALVEFVEAERTAAAENQSLQPETLLLISPAGFDDLWQSMKEKNVRQYLLEELSFPDTRT